MVASPWIDRNKGWFADPARASQLPSGKLLLGLVDGSLALALFVGLWSPGAGHPWVSLAITVFALTASLSWIAREHSLAKRLTWIRSPADGIFLAAVALVVLQLLPLGETAFEFLAPRTAKLLPIWTLPGEEANWLGGWQQVSLHPAATRLSLAGLLVYGLLFFTAVQRIEQLEDVERLLRCLALAVLVAAIFAVSQCAGSPPVGAIPRANASLFLFLACGAGPTLWCLQRSLRQPRSELERLGDHPSTWSQCGWLLALVAMWLAAALTLAGPCVAAMAVAIAVCAWLLYRQANLSGAWTFSIMAATACVALALNLRMSFARPAIDLRALADFCILGGGIGSEQVVRAAYETSPQSVAGQGSQFLTVALEAGLPGLALVVGALLFVAHHCWQTIRQLRSRRMSAAAAGVIGGLLGVAGCGMLGPIWSSPSAIVATLLLAACAVRLRQLYQREAAATVTVSKPVLLGAAFSVALLGAWLLNVGIRQSLAAPHWQAWNVLVAQRPAPPADASVAAIQHLRQIVRWTPEDAQAHLLLAAVYLGHFNSQQQAHDGALAVDELRGAMQAADVDSAATLDAWLMSIAGEDRKLLYAADWHARQAAKLCPLEGRAYVYLAELAALHRGENRGEIRTEQNLVEQAKRVRPFDSAVIRCSANEPWSR